MNNFGEQTGEIYATRDFREIGVGKLGTDQINGVGIDTDFGGPCNQSCVQCYKALTHTGRKELIPMDHFRRILDEAKDVDGHEIYLLGTDTLMHPSAAQHVLHLDSSRL